MTHRSRTRPLAPVVALMTLALAGCAPPAPVPLPERATVMQRYDAARAQRERLARGLRADVLIWSRLGDQALPGASGALLIEAPHGARLTLGAAFGTALDAAARDDTLEAWLPGRRRAVRLDATRAGLASPPQRNAVRALAATWTPPGGAWDRALASDSGWVVRWAEGADTLVLVVDRDGRPSAAEWHPAGGDTLRVRYRSWVSVAGVAWPDRHDWSESAHALSARVRLERVTPREGSAGARLRVAIPPAALEGAVAPGDLETWWRELLEEGR